jgi:REP-associated tyrosine transposase
LGSNGIQGLSKHDGRRNNRPFRILYATITSMIAGLPLRLASRPRFRGDVGVRPLLLIIWDELEAQSLLGVEGFAEGLRHFLSEKQQIREIPKGQRFVGRPALEKLFSRRSMSKQSRGQLMTKAVGDYGYSQMALASFLNLHYSTISRMLDRESRSKG